MGFLVVIEFSDIILKKRPSSWTEVSLWPVWHQWTNLMMLIICSAYCFFTCLKLTAIPSKQSLPCSSNFSHQSHHSIKTQLTHELLLITKSICIYSFGIMDLWCWWGGHVISSEIFRQQWANNLKFLLWLGDLNSWNLATASMKVCRDITNIR